MSAVVPGRADAAPTGGALPPQLVQQVLVAGEFGVPADAAMVAANVTAINPAADGYLTVFACDEEQPTTSNVNYFANQIAPNLVLSGIAADGTICIATRAVTDIFVDLVGYVPSGSALTPLPVPVRAVDTRGPAGDQPPLPARGVLEIPIAGQFGVAADATVVMFNATAIAGDQSGYLTAYPCGTPPTTSSVNYLAGQVVPNLVTARLSSTGSVCISTLSPAHVIVDIAAYATDGIETLATPQRVLDTRSAAGLLAAGATTTIDVTSRSDVPDDAAAAVYNLTSVGATGPGFATSFPCDAPARPEASNLNYDLGKVVANGTITKLSATGQLCIYNLAPTHLIVDLVGYTRGEAHYVPLTPVRIDDTRTGWEPCGVALMRGDNGIWVATRVNGATTRVMLPADATPPPVALIDPSCSQAITRSSDGRTWAAPLDGGPATLLDVSPGEAFDIVEVLDDGSVVTRSFTGLGILGEAGTFAPLGLGSPSQVWISTDGAFVVQSDVFTGEVWRWDVVNAKRAEAVRFSGDRLLDVSPDGQLALWRAPGALSGKYLTTWDGAIIADARLPTPSFRFVGSSAVWSASAGGGVPVVPLFGGPAIILQTTSVTDFGITKPLIYDLA